MELRAARDRLEALTRAVEGLEEGTPRDVRAAVRGEIVGLYHEVDAAVEELVEMRAAVRALGERFRRAGAAPEVRGRSLASAEGVGRAEALDLATHLERAWAHLAACRHVEALEAAERALERAPGNARAAVLRGWALTRLRRLEEARRVLEDVLRAAPGEGLGHAALGYLALCEGGEEEAVEHLTLAAGADGDRTATLYAQLYLGMLELRRGRYEDARAHLARALEIGPALAEAHWEMGRAYYLEGRSDRALECWRLGAEVNRFDPWGERCQEAVELANGGIPVLLD